MKYLKRVEGECENCIFDDKCDLGGFWGKPRCDYGDGKDYCFRLATPAEIAEYKRKHPERCRNIGPESICPLSDNVVGDNQSCVGCQYAVLINYNAAMELLCAHPSELQKEASDGK